MRFAKLALIASSFLVLAGASIAEDAGRILGGTPRSLNFTPVDTSKAIGTGNMSKALSPMSNAANSPFNLSGVFPKLSLGLWKPTTPQVSVLPQAQNKFQPNVPKGGVNLFNMSPNKK